MVRVSDGKSEGEGGGDLGVGGVEGGEREGIDGEDGDTWTEDKPHDEEDGPEDDEDGDHGGEEPPEEGGAWGSVWRRRVVVRVVVWVVVVGVRVLLWVPVLGLGRVSGGGPRWVGHRKRVWGVLLLFWREKMDWSGGGGRN